MGFGLCGCMRLVEVAWVWELVIKFALEGLLDLDV